MNRELYFPTPVYIQDIGTPELNAHLEQNIINGSVSRKQRHFDHCSAQSEQSVDGRRKVCGEVVFRTENQSWCRWPGSTRHFRKTPCSDCGSESGHRQHGKGNLSCTDS